MNPLTRLRPLWFVLLLGILLSLGVAGYSGSSALIQAQNCPLITTVDATSAEVFGRSRFIRSDEWSVELPKQRGQQLAQFPLVNLNEGLGQLQRNSYPIPVLDWGIVFRPLLWPVLFEGPTGFAVRWFGRSALLLLSLLLWLRVLLPQGSARTEASAANVEPSSNGAWRSHLLALAALSIFFSSAVTWWMSSPISELLVFCGFAVAAGERLLLAQSRALRAVCWLTCTYLLTCAFGTFYPPMWAPLLWVVCATSVDRAVRARASLRQGLLASLPFLASVFVAVCIAIAYYAPYLLSLLHTAYPGARTVSAGGFSVLRLLTLAWPSVGIVGPWTEPELYFGREHSNVCEYAAVEVIPLAALLSMALVRGPVRQAWQQTLRGHRFLLLALLVLVIWDFLPAPDVFGTLSLLRWSIPTRAWVGLGLGAALFTAALLVSVAETEATTTRRGFRELACAGAATLALFVPLQSFFGKKYDEGVAVYYWLPLILAVLLTLLGVAQRVRQRGVLLMALGWAVPLVAVNLGVNPLVKASALIPEGDGHRLLQAVVSTAPGRFVEYQTHTGAELVGEGFATLGGVHVAPDLNLFNFLASDTPGYNEEMVNRYAHIQFALPPQSSALLFPDFALIAISPCSERLKTLWVNHFLALPSDTLPAKCAEQFATRRAGAVTLWSRQQAVQAVGIARTPRFLSALDFDFTTPNPVRLTRKRDALLIDAPGGGLPFATALNLSLIDNVVCSGATATTLDAHVVISPHGNEPVHCAVQFLGTRGALKQLFGAPAYSTKSQPKPKREQVWGH